MVVFGGRSREHEVSLASARAIMEALDRRHEVVPVGITREGSWISSGDPMRELESKKGELAGTSGPPASTGEKLPAALDSVDVVWPVLHGPYGEDGTVQGLLELAGIPYVGAGVLASALCMDKVLFKDVLAAAGVPQVDYAAVRRGESPDLARLGPPLVVHPNRPGLAGTPSVGGGLLAAAFARDRAFLKTGRAPAGGPRANSAAVPGGDPRALPRLGLPLFVKPNRLGSSVGIGKVASEGELDAA